MEFNNNNDRLCFYLVSSLSVQSMISWSYCVFSQTQAQSYHMAVLYGICYMWYTFE